MHDWTILQLLGYNEYLFSDKSSIFFFFLRFLASFGPAVTNVLIKYVQLSDLYKQAKTRESKLVTAESGKEKIITIDMKLKNRNKKPTFHI